MAEEFAWSSYNNNNNLDSVTRQRLKQIKESNERKPDICVITNVHTKHKLH